MTFEIGLILQACTKKPKIIFPVMHGDNKNTVLKSHIIVGSTKQLLISQGDGWPSTVALEAARLLTVPAVLGGTGYLRKRGWPNRAPTWSKHSLSRVVKKYVYLYSSQYIKHLSYCFGQKTEKERPSKK